MPLCEWRGAVRDIVRYVTKKLRQSGQRMEAERKWRWSKVKGSSGMAAEP